MSRRPPKAMALQTSLPFGAPPRERIQQRPAEQKQAKQTPSEPTPVEPLVEPMSLPQSAPRPLGIPELTGVLPADRSPSPAATPTHVSPGAPGHVN